ncbi:hypothetical protein BBJ28_00000307 [Nothophytophthora sp. Chile5]|nr:hypothetical protein BBJ28_00000307 [Nothophytophthora sp. Chile5]
MSATVMSSAPTSTSSSASEMLSPRLSRMSSSSGSFSTKSLQGFRTVALPGLFPGTHLGILASGLLDKRRDGAVRGGWAKRLFILSTRSLHYYRKAEEFELFGKERGQTLLLFLRADSFDYASSWVSIVNNAVHTAKSVDFAPRWAVDVMQTFISAASGNFEDAEVSPADAPTEETSAPVPMRQPPNVLVVSMVSGLANQPSTTERLVKRNVELNTDLQLGVFGKNDSCILVLSDGEELQIPQHLLGGNLLGLLTSEKQIELVTPARSQPLRPNIVSVSKVTAQDGKQLSLAMSPTAASRKPAAGLENELLFYLKVDKIEVIESDQDLEPTPKVLESQSPVSEVSGVDSPNSVSTDASAAPPALAISGGPIAFSPRFIAGEKGDEEKGRQRYLNTLEWREENQIDNILVTPHPHFEIIKKYYPQYFHGRTRAGLPVYYERPGKIDLPALKREGLSIEDLLRHYMYITEYLWRVVEPNDAGRSITVLDVTGIGMYDLGGEVLDFIKRASSFTGAHYPERSAHIFIINIPGWFNMIWRMVKPLIDPVTREKVSQHRSDAVEGYFTLIDLDQIPSDLGGNGPALGDSVEEHALAAHERGARNALLQLTEEEKRNGVVAASAGNHAQALAYHGMLLGIPVTCVMPQVAPLTKIMRCRELGARVILHGQHILEARDKADEYVRDENLVYVNGFDRPEIIAGAGTMGIEILNQVPNVDAVIVPVGGGGLIAGIALAVKTLAPNVQVIVRFSAFCSGQVAGVEPENCSSFTKALEAGKPVDLSTLPTLADGLAVPRVGANAFELARQHVDKVVTVSERAIALSVLRLVEMEKVVVEGGGAASLAALIDHKLPELKGKRVVLPLTGGNIDTPVLGRVIDRGLAADGRLVRFVATVSDRPGGIAQLTCFLRDFGVSVKDIYHERAWVHASISHVAVKCVVETQSSEHGLELKQRLEEEGYPLIWESYAAHTKPDVEL